MTKFKKIALAGVTALAFASTPVFAAPYTAPSASGKATVRLYNAIEFEKVTDIDFGTVIRDASLTGSVNVAMANDGTTDCASVAGISCTGSTSAGLFTIKGDNGSDMSVSISSADWDAPNTRLFLRQGADQLVLSLAVDGMVQDTTDVYDNTDPANPVLLSSTPNSNFSLTGTGATENIVFYGSLNIPDSATVPNGVYEATFTLTADYK